MLLRLDMTGDAPIYQQVRNQIVLGIGSGKLKPGQSLPTVRQLAEDAGINAMTVSKAYTILKEEGFIEIDRRHGAKISQSLSASSAFLERLEEELSLIIAESRARGLDFSSFAALSQKLFNDLNPNGGAQNV